MKWVFLLGLLVLTPALSAFLAKNPRHLPKAAFVLGLMPFLEVGFNVSASPIVWPGWPGMVKGIELSLTDAVAIAMIVAGSKFHSPTRIRFAFGLYLLAVLISWVVSTNKMSTMFYVWQVLRALLVFYAVARASMRDRDVPLALLTGLIVGLSIQALVATYQFATGEPNAGGWFGHQNLLGMVSHSVVYPAFAVFLGGYYRKRAALAVAAGLIIAFVGASRATIGLLLVGMIFTALFSIWHRTSGRKMGFAVGAMIFVGVVSPLLYSAIQRRSEDQRMGSSEERVRMADAARMMAVDHPLGIGANNYVMVSNLGGYSARAGVGWQTGAAPVHNTYYLVYAEQGMLGLMAIVALLLAALTTAIKALRKAAPGFGGEYAAGIAASFVTIMVHAYVEWITMLYYVHILFAMSLGVVAAQLFSVTKSSRVRQPVRARPRPIPADGPDLGRQTTH